MRITPEISSYIYVKTTERPARRENLPLKTGAWNINPFKNDISNDFSPSNNTLDHDIFIKTAPNTTPATKAVSAPSFGGHHCAVDDFKIKQFYNTPCPYCGKKMLLNNQVAAFSRNIKTKHGKELADELSRYDDVYRPFEKQIVGIIKTAAQEHPEFGIKQIVQMEDELLRQSLEENETEILTDLKQGAPLIEDDQFREVYTDFLEQNLTLIKSKDQNQYFTRKTFIKEFEDLSQIMPVSPENAEQYKAICKRAYALPTSKSNLNAFFAKYSKKSETEIAERLLKPAGVTTEHIVPSSKDGEDNTANYLAECNDCNSKRGNTDFNIWIKDNPDIKQNLQAYLDFVAPRIEEENLVEYSTYTDDIIATIFEVTDGKISLKKPEVSTSKKPTNEPQKPQKTKLSPEEKTKKLTAEIESSYSRIAQITKKKAEFETTQEYQDYVNYIKFVRRLEGLQAKSEEDKKAYRTAQKRLSRQTKKDTGKNTSQREMENMRELYQKSRKATETYRQEKLLFESFLERFETPNALQNRLSALNSRIDKVGTLYGKISEIGIAQQKIESLKVQSREIENKIKQKMAQIAQIESSKDFSSPENKKAAADYICVVEKLRIISLVNPNIFKAYFKEVPKISKSFILDEASNSLNREKEALLQTKGGQYAKLKTDVTKLEKQKEDIEAQISKGNALQKEKEKINENIERVLDGKTYKSLIDERNQARAKSDRYKEYEEILNSDKLIERLKSLAQEAESELLASLPKEG